MALRMIPGNGSGNGLPPGGAARPLATLDEVLAEMRQLNAAVLRVLENQTELNTRMMRLETRSEDDHRAVLRLVADVDVLQQANS